jgi:hypothetical protein
VHAADGTPGYIKPLVQRYRSWFKLFRLLADAAFANPENYPASEVRVGQKFSKNILF